MTYRTEFGDYDAMYGAVDVKDAYVLDVGADYGSTAEYFLKRGAARVFVSEKDPEFRERLLDYVASQPLASILAPANAPLAGAWLAEFAPDVVKMDCERCEVLLYEVPDDLLSGPRAWMIETHTREIQTRLTALFERLGYVVRQVDNWQDRTPDRCIHVIHAVRP